MIKTAYLAFGLIFALGSPIFAAEFKCAICSMKIQESARNHILVKHKDPKKEALHVCSIPCALKAKKYDSNYSTLEFVDFNRPTKIFSGEKAFFLIKSEKIKADLDSMAMPPYFAAFENRKEAEALQREYGDGQVVQGTDNLFK